MPDPRLIQRETTVLQRLEQLIRQRAERATAAEANYKSRHAAAVEAAEHNRQSIEQRFTAARADAERHYRQTLAELTTRFEHEHGTAQQEYDTLKTRIEQRFKSEKVAAKRALEEASWETQTVFDATKNKPRREYLEAERQVNARAERLEQIANEAKDFLAACRMYRPPELVPVELGPEVGEAEALKLFLDGLTRAETLLVALKNLKLPKFFGSGTPFWFLFLVWMAAVYPTGVAMQWDLKWVPISIGVGIVIGGAIMIWVYQVASYRVHRSFDPLCQLLLDTEAARTRWVEQGTARWQCEAAEIKHRHQTELKRASDKYNFTKRTSRERRDTEIAGLEAKYPSHLNQLRITFDEQKRSLDTLTRQKLAELNATHEAESRAEHERADREQADVDGQHRADRQTMDDCWQQGLEEVAAEVAAIEADTATQFPDWDSPAWDTWQPPLEVARAVRFGTIDVHLDQIPGSESLRTDGKGGPKIAYRLPALLDFPQHCSLVLRTAGSGRARAVEVLQAAMLRFLTAVPPGKLRFTIIDPVGLGQNFGGFMHLADYDELLVTHKIWTDPQQIEHRLADLTAHMANVIQKYLRNEYDTIEDYNRHAGEVAEPFRVLVVANFPFGFSDAALRHLMSIANTGARCGVYVLLSIDSKLPLPHGFRLADLEQNAARLVWREEGFVWKDPVYERFPLSLESPPSQERFSQVVHMVGRGAKDANRVEVPFEFIAPPDDEWWTGDTAKGIDVALGRAGATKRQFLRLGRGTAQHVLIAGKTGSGKSTLMHALITNLALVYSPEQVQVYLIDFKKGVEFKTYAEYQLPHARVIAIESEREFGLSVLQRLDAELKARGDLFRDLGVADVNGYRGTGAKAPMPRILLIVDEFQEFFVEDDKISQDVSLLLDRLVRQGRAFGIHVHLGSQTLGGAYSLPRTTLGQFAIRIALQCSEADANLILSEENSAARLLTRPGEAIYNDANGRSEGNNLFQVVWLTDQKHESYLRRVNELAQRRGIKVEGQIVFEGNIPADSEKNHLLAEVLSHAGSPSPAGLVAAQAWLGDAIAIKDPTAAVFRQQSGNNMLMIGQQPEAALSMMCIATVAIAAQQPSAKFYALDGQAPDSDLIGTLPRLARVLPQGLDLGAPRDTGRIIGELATELENRQASAAADAPAVYCFIYDLQRFRDLRKAEDDFSFSKGSDKPNPAKQLVNILREGPALGIHVIVWADTLNNVQRSFERATLREFELRVLFQMSVADSSTLIDSPAASRLGPNRAFLHSEEQGRLEKFRPYRLPDEAWLARVAEQLRTGAPAVALPAAETPLPGAVVHES
ncbi:MAG TPA: FtsK/SpoIIIE domain-containing protein [Pirellulales bacterium]|jgi:energy-coupling factor transporter ATP-binding protein EcfA2|nr:FtsK/SpoIIIE domain-containing protein [Pirellulales bacterium]